MKPNVSRKVALVTDGGGNTELRARLNLPNRECTFVLSPAM